MVRYLYRLELFGIGDGLISDGVATHVFLQCRFATFVPLVIRTSSCFLSTFLVRFVNFF